MFSDWLTWDPKALYLVASTIFVFHFFCSYFSTTLFRISSLSCFDQLQLFPAMRRQSPIVSCCMLSQQSCNTVVKRLSVLSTALFDTEKNITSSTSISKFGNSFFLYWNIFSQRFCSKIFVISLACDLE